LRGASASALVAGTAIATAALGHGAQPAAADAELIALAHEFLAYDARLLAFNRTEIDTPESEWEAVHPRWWQIVDRMTELPAHTEAGRVAKASLLPSVMRDTCGASMEPAERLALSLVRDMLDPMAPALVAFAAEQERAAEQDARYTPAPPRISPDAELIALCDRLVEIEAQRCIVFDTIADDAAQDAATAPIDQERLQIEARLYGIGDPQTLAGTCAMSRAAIAEASKQSDGTMMALDLHTWLALGVIEYHGNPIWGPRA
jgi:hypothetical protein